MRVLSRQTDALSNFNYIEGLDPYDGDYYEFEIVGAYVDKDPYSEGLRLRRENGSIFDAPINTLKTETRR